MATPERARLRPLRVERPIDHGQGDSNLSDVPHSVPERGVASHGISTTEGNGAGLPRADLHVALLVPDEATARLLGRARIVRPPYWQGKVHLHVVVSPDLSTDDVMVLQAAADLGWGVSKYLISPPAEFTLGYPTEEKS